MMFNKAQYQQACIYAAECIFEKEKSGYFNSTKASTNPHIEYLRNQGKLEKCPELQNMPFEYKNPNETVSYTLVKGQKASAAVRTLIENKKSSCTMTCQMAGQLCVYYGLLKVMGDELFDKIFTETMPLILRDFTTQAGQPFICGFPYTAYRSPLMANVAAHPLALFLEMRSNSSINLGDNVAFTNVEQYSEIASMAVKTNQAKAISTCRRMECVCIGQNNDGEQIYYSFGPKLTKLTKSDVAVIMMNSHNHNLKILNPNTKLITESDVLNSGKFYQEYLHNSLVESLVNFVINHPDKAIEQFKEYQKSLIDERKKFDNLPNQDVPLRVALINNMYNMGLDNKKNKNYDVAISALTASATERIRGATQDNINMEFITKLTDTYYQISLIHELKGSDIQALRFARLMVQIHSMAKTEPLETHVEALAKMNNKYVDKTTDSFMPVRRY